MYLVMGVAEMLVSATGLEFAYSQSPPSFRGTVLALFFLTTFLGDSMQGAFYEPLSRVLTLTQLNLALAAGMSASGAVFAVLAWRYVPVSPDAWAEDAPGKDGDVGGDGGDSGRGGAVHAAGGVSVELGLVRLSGAGKGEG
jgi:hypothetical protein